MYKSFSRGSILGRRMIKLRGPTRYADMMLPQCAMANGARSAAALTGYLTANHFFFGNFATDSLTLTVPFVPLKITTSSPVGISADRS
jgi:hypothetical protein